MVLLTRRQLIRALGGAAAIAAIGCGDNLHPPETGPFTSAQRAALAAFADVIIPPDDDPGGAQLGAVAYIETLLAAFAVSPPAIFADGPYSGRHGGSADFARFVELDRVSEAAWRLRLDTLGDRIKAGLDAAIEVHGADLAKLPPTELNDVFDAQDDAWKDLMIELVTEAAFCAPEYGGNIDLAGWKLCNFEGDSMPAGYIGDAVSAANPGPDPAPLDSDVEDLLKIVVAFLGGRTA